MCSACTDDGRPTQHASLAHADCGGVDYEAVSKALFGGVDYEAVSMGLFGGVDYKAVSMALRCCSALSLSAVAACFFRSSQDRGSLFLPRMDEFKVVPRPGSLGACLRGLVPRKAPRMHLHSTETERAHSFPP